MPDPLSVTGFLDRPGWWLLFFSFISFSSFGLTLSRGAYVRCHHFSDRFSMRSCPERAYVLAFFAPPPPSSPQRQKPGYAEIIFAHILVFPACAIEVQYINENSPTMKFTCDYSFTPIPFLDVSVSLHNGKIVTDLYTKPTDKHQYLLNKENIK